MTHRWMPLAGLPLLALLACGGESPPPAVSEGEGEPLPALEVTGAYLFAPITEAQAAGYFVLHNRGEDSDTLLRVSADWAEDGMVHETREEDGRVRMRHLAALPVPARDSVVLRPGGLHVMLMRLSRMPVAGETVDLRLEFASDAVLDVRAAVRPYGQEFPED